MDKHPLSNFISESMQNYPLIFSTPVEVLSHLFFTIGNGFDCDSLGVPTTREWKDEPAEYLHKYPEHNYYSMLATDLTSNFLYCQIRAVELTRSAKSKSRPIYMRPYPLSYQYSQVFRVSKSSPMWLQQTVIPLCRAWVRFLSEELIYNHVHPGTDWANEQHTREHHDMLVNFLHQLGASVYD